MGVANTKTASAPEASLTRRREVYFPCQGPFKKSVSIHLSATHGLWSLLDSMSSNTIRRSIGIATRESLVEQAALESRSLAGLIVTRLLKHQGSLADKKNIEAEVPETPAGPRCAEEIEIEIESVSCKPLAGGSHL